MLNKINLLQSDQIRLISYNSKLPIVVYVPADIQVKYRIWNASETTQDAVNK